MKFHLFVGLVLMCLLQGKAFAQQAEVAALIERAVQQVRSKFPEDADERLGPHRTSYLRFATTKQIESFIAQTPGANTQPAIKQLIGDWYRANPEAYSEIFQFAQTQGVAISDMTWEVRRAGLKAIALGRIEEGERLLSLLPAFPSGQHDKVNLIVAYASGRDFAAADKRLPEVLEVSLDSAQQTAHQFASVGYVQGAVAMIEKFRGRPQMLYVVAAALKGAAASKETVNVSSLVRFIDVAQLENLSVDDLTDDKNSSWTRAFEPCESVRKLLFPARRPYLLEHVPLIPPIVDCFRWPPGPITSLALLLFDAGEKDLAEKVLDRAVNLLLSMTTPENIEVYQSATVPRRPLTKEDIVLAQRMQKYMSSLANVAHVATAMESAMIGQKVLSGLRATDQIRAEFLLSMTKDMAAFEQELRTWAYPEHLSIEAVRFEWGLRRNDPAIAIAAFDKLIRDGNFRSHALALLFTHHVTANNLAVERTRNHFLEGIRTARVSGALKSGRFAYVVMSTYLNYVIAFGEGGLASELARDRFDTATTEVGLDWSADARGYYRATRISSALLDCYLLNAICPMASIHFNAGDRKALDRFNANLTDVLARAGRMDEALLHVRRISEPFADVKAYPEYLREAWGHLAHAYARQGDIEKALAIIGEGKAGKPGGTIDAVVDGWIAAGHYKRQ